MLLEILTRIHRDRAGGKRRDTDRHHDITRNVVIDYRADRAVVFRNVYLKLECLDTALYYSDLTGHIDS